ncbi:MAG TPA: sugar phosphate nucleotidyltransferase [Candidatus Saccharimonadia bacterium]|jgi:mannose-1-phosphate guanylyltransferase/mannose-6-phosphate isomerase|nr:sugar phosphate nucleotidyltransferase [Candidatus Saccharimonadia bacterium]
MIIVIIAGGSGTRLWPLSVGNYPKHLLNLTGSRSGVQEAFDRAKRITNDIYVVTEASHAHHVREQLPELGDEAFIVEPGRRGTASCFIAALDRVSRHHDLEEPIGFLWADHFIRDVDGFVHAFKSAAEHSKKHGRVTLVGIEPTHASTLFGYIEKGEILDKEAFVSEVVQFKEKPDLELARKFYASGKYLWNGGYTVGSVNSFLNAMEKYAPERFKDYHHLQGAKNQEDYNDIYLSFENDAIDYAFSEKVPNLLVVPATFDWLDIGSFKELYEANDPDGDGNVMSGTAPVETIEVENSFIRNDGEKPVAVIGLDNIVVVNTPNGILVARKDLSHRVKDIVKKLS